MNIVCITGMHRSGTSLVSRVVNLLGVDLGPESDLMPAKPDNPLGFWENRTVSGLNDDLLAALGGNWADPPLLVDGWEHDGALDGFRDHAGRALDGLAGGAGPVGVKDPRMSLLLPFWATVASVDATILTVRSPAEVAASLAARDDIDAELSAWLWLRYMVAACRADPKRLSVRYEDLIRNLDHEIERICEHLGLPEPSPETRRAIADFVSPDMRHHAGIAVETGPNMALAATLYDLLTEDRSDVIDAFAETLQATWVAERESGRAGALLAASLDERDGLIAHRDQVLVERDVAMARGEELDRTLAEAVAHRDRALAERDTAVARGEELDHSLAALGTERDLALARAAELEDGRHHLEARLRIQRDSLERAEEISRALRMERAERVAALEEQEALIRRWRIRSLERILRRWRLM